jgi:hypothetical protein
MALPYSGLHLPAGLATVADTPDIGSDCLDVAHQHQLIDCPHFQTFQHLVKHLTGFDAAQTDLSNLTTFRLQGCFPTGLHHDR